MTIWCLCRNCGKKYDDSKARGDWKGYCSAACTHEKARSLGYRKPPRTFLARKQLLYPSEYEVLSKANKIGSVCFEHQVPFLQIGTRTICPECNLSNEDKQMVMHQLGFSWKQKEASKDASTIKELKKLKESTSVKPQGSV